MPTPPPLYKRQATRLAYWLAAGFLLAGLLAWDAAQRTRSGYSFDEPDLQELCGSDIFYYVATAWVIIALIPWLVVRFLRANALGWQKLSWFSLLSCLAMVGCLHLHSMLDTAVRDNLVPHGCGISWWDALGLGILFLMRAAFVLLCCNESGNAFLKGDGKGAKAVSRCTLAKVALILPALYMTSDIILVTRFAYTDPEYLTQEDEPVLPPPDSLQADDFAFDVFREVVAGNRGNIIFSPAGLESQMRLLRQAAGGATREAIDSLRMGKPGVRSAMRVCQAQAVFVDKTLPLKHADAADVIRAPFSTHPELAAAIFRRWVSDATKGCIPAAVFPRDVTTDTRIISVGTICLDEKWLHPFDYNDTYTGTFHLADGTEVETPMMEQTGYFLCADGEDWQAVALFYRTGGRPGEPGCFIGILPKGDAREFAQALTAEKYNEIRLELARAERVQIQLHLPKMEVGPQDIRLDAPLQKQGLGALFDPETADFSNLTDERGHICSVRQCCYIKVDELGTVAASATRCEHVFSCFMDDHLYFDRPFIWAIGDLTSDAPPYFLGLFEKP